MISKKRSLKLLTLVIITFFFSINALGQDGIEFQEIQDGIRFAKISNYQSSISQNSISINIIKIDRRQNRVVVLDSREVLNKNPISESFIYSLRNVYQVSKPIAVINGGFTASFRTPIPVGLIVHDGRTLSPMNKNYRARTQEGIFCILNSQIDGVRIINSDEYKRCFEALQNGPIIIKNGVNNIHNSRDKFINNRFARSIVAIDKQNNILLIQTSRASLPELVEFLLKDESEGGLSCVSALNLSGSSDSGMILKSDREIKSFGLIDSTVPSVIAVFPRR